jgi:23S rRNA pseudouridine1911/1915/1917 synthase
MIRRKRARLSSENDSREPEGSRLSPSKVDPLFEIIHEDDALLVINKPAGLVCHPTKGDIYSSLISRARLHVGDGTDLHLINRLDRETSGVVLIAKGLESARAMRRVFEERRVTKTYQAIVAGHLKRGAGVIEEPIDRDRSSIVAIKRMVSDDGKTAFTEFETIREFTRPEGDFSLLCVRPRSGRTHQIRVHLSQLGYPIVGDKIYGPDEQLFLDFIEGRLTEEQWQTLILPHQALHAESLEFELAGVSRRFCAAPEPWFAEFLVPVPASPSETDET